MGTDIQSLGVWLVDGLTTHGSAVSRFCSGTGQAKIACEELLTRSLRLARGLRSLGVQPGDPVVIQLPHSVDNAVAVHAIWFLGAVVVPVSPVAGVADLVAAVDTTAAAVVVTPARWRHDDWDQRATVVTAAAPQCQIVTSGGSLPSAVATVEDLMGHGSLVGPAVRSDGPAGVVFSSGSTARPKGVVHTGASLIAAATGWNERLGVDRETVSLNVLPPGHIGGLSTFVRMALSGCDSVYLEAWDARTALDLIAERGPVVTSGTPFHLSALVDQGRNGSSPFANLRTYVVGAARVPPGLVEQSARAGIVAVRSYGSSEHPVATMGQPGETLEVRASNDGPALSGTRVRIRGPAGQLVPPGEEGEIELEGPQQFRGYLDPSLDGQVFTADRWFRTGDVGVMDGAGRLRVIGRLDDVVIRGGENISLAEVEAILSGFPMVERAAATAVSDDRYGERVAAVVMLRRGATLDIDGLRTEFRHAGATVHKTPEYLVVADALPVTETGKVDKVQLRRLAEDWAAATRGQAPDP
jgi:acyl-CoA synthetase (AMP-forming)/AMP-acid ligase II